MYLGEDFSDGRQRALAGLTINNTNTQKKYMKKVLKKWEDFSDGGQRALAGLTIYNTNTQNINIHTHNI